MRKGNNITLQEGIEKAIQEFGENIIQEYRLVNILADYHALDKSPQTKIILDFLLKDNFFRIIKDDCLKFPAEEVLNKYLELAEKKYPFKRLTIKKLLLNVIDVFKSRFLSDESSNYVLSHYPKEPDCSYLSFADLFPLDGVVIGKTTVNDLKVSGKDIELEHLHGAPYYIYRPTKFWRLFWTNNFEEVFEYVTLGHASDKCSIFDDPFPDEWRSKFGLDFNSSYKEWRTKLKEFGFTIKIEKDDRFVNLYAKSKKRDLFLDLCFPVDYDIIKFKTFIGKLFKLVVKHTEY